MLIPLQFASGAAAAAADATVSYYCSTGYTHFVVGFMKFAGEEAVTQASVAAFLSR